MSAADFARATGLSIGEDATAIRIHTGVAWTWVELLQVSEDGETMDIRFLEPEDSRETVPQFSLGQPVSMVRKADRHLCIPGKVYRRQCALCRQEIKKPIYHAHLNSVVGQVWSRKQKRYVVFRGHVCDRHLQYANWQTVRKVREG